jgi:hypothetical protein
MILNLKRTYADDLALILIEIAPTDVTEEQVKQWNDNDLYEWLEAWGYEWNEKEGSWLADKES